MSTLEVGQELYYVSERHNRHEEFPVVVAKVGRKYATIAKPSLRTQWPSTWTAMIYLEGLQEYLPNYSSEARCYLSRDEYEDEKTRERLWREIRKKVSDHLGTPRALTALRMTGILELLEVEDADPEA